jgi:integrase
LHSSVAAILKEFIGRRTSGLLFCSSTGKQLWQTNTLRRSLHPILKDLGWKDLESGCKKTGAHAFRRFRLTWLRKNDVPKDLEHFWMGHEDEEIGDRYSKLKDDVAFRKEVVERIGLGFELPSKKVVVGPNGPKIEVGDVELLAVNA